MQNQTYHDTINQLQETFLFEYPSDAALEIEAMPLADIVDLFDSTPFKKIEGAVQNLSDDLLISIVDLSTDTLGRQIVLSLPIDRINKIIVGVEPSKRHYLLSVIPKTVKHEIVELQKYPSGTAGNIMDPNVIHFTPVMTVKEAISKIKLRKKKGIRSLFISDDQGKLHSVLTMQQIILEDEHTKLGVIAQPVVAFVSDFDQQDEIVEKLEKYKLTDIPVVDLNGRFIGVVRHHTLVDLTKEELTKDILTMVGVSEDERALSNVFFAVRKRLPWLEINLLTAFLAAGVVGLFESTIAQFTALAVLLPVVAGQSGNTGAQALAVTMRGLALKEVRTSQWMILVLKELGISLLTGTVVAITTAIGVYLWSRSLGLTFIIGISMIISMVLASMSGAAVPIILSRLGQDPAASSSILLTTVTDVFGFFSFLGIATVLSKYI